ncbi:MAG TPA: IS21 family transposase [Bryobacteraceae bacterium]|nr:IS21 family transposase [Bryobacteraceae bacterium]
MANQLKMAEVQAILALARSGWSNRRIARQLGVHRETVSRHRRLDLKPASAPLGSEGASSGSNSASTGSQCAPLGAISTAGLVSAAGAWREVIEQKLEVGLTARRIYQDLCSDHDYAGSYYSVRRLVNKLSAAAPAPFRRMECEPGTEAQVDFGRGAPVVSPDGKKKSTWVFRIVLSHSRKGYAEAVHRQTTDDFLRCLENAFAHFGGVPRTLVIDNLRAAVTRADWFDPELCPKVRSFAEHYGVAILPTRPYTPRHKGKIERGIGYVKSNALKGRTFPSLEQQNQHLAHWETSVADTRIHGTTRRQVKEVFAAEKPALLPLPASRFDLFQEALRSVHRDGHVEIKGAYYSVPAEFVGQRLWARWDGRIVRLLDQKMRVVATHVQRQPGVFSTHGEHILPEKISGIEKGTSWLLRRIEYIGPHASQWAQSMLQHRGIEGVRVLMGLLSLMDKHARASIDQACRVAHSHGAYHLRSVRQLIDHQNAMTAATQQSFEFIDEHPIIRDLGDYGQFVRDVITRTSQTSLQESS